MEQIELAASRGEVDMQNDTERTSKYYSPGAQAKVEERKKIWSPELQAEVSLKWAQLSRAVIRKIQNGLNAMWADQANWPSPQRQSYSIKPEVQEFIVAAINARHT